MMRLKLELEEKKQAMVLLQRALVRPSAITPRLSWDRACEHPPKRPEPLPPTALPLPSPPPGPRCLELGARQGFNTSISCPCSLQAQQRDLTARRVKETEKELSRQLRQQKEQYEATIQRHLSFIDQVTVREVVLTQGGTVGRTPEPHSTPSQLIEDKKVLSDKCEAVVAELKLGDRRCQERVAQMQEQHELVSICCGEAPGAVAAWQPWLAWNSAS